MTADSSRKKLEAIGVDAVCDAIGKSISMTQIAAGAGVSMGSMLAWIASDADRSARVREAREAMALAWDEKAEDVISGARDEFELRKAKELGHHYRWRASKIAPKDYGDRQSVEHSGGLTLEQLVTGKK